VPSALIPLITLPVAVLVAFIPFRALGITANIMSLGGIAIAMGELVDAAIVVVEQTHKKLEQAQREGSTRDYHQVVLEAVKEVAPASFFALLVIAVSFLPVLTLESQEGRWPTPRPSRCSWRPPSWSRSTPRCACSSRACGALSFGRRGSAG
jgi:Cu(I)/Ag(I) efflux system membrane protein CusA/SilA